MTEIINSNENYLPQAVTGSAQQNTIDVPAHDFGAIQTFLSTLDPGASKFAIQFLAEGNDAAVPYDLRGVRHLTIEEIITLVECYNTPSFGLGVFLVINQTDGLGRRTENIRRVRSLVLDVDHDGKSVISKLAEKLAAHAIVQTSKEKFHAYWFVTGIKLEDFKPLQQALAKRYGGDPTVCDLSRLMRLPGSLHLKKAAQPVRLRGLRSEIKPYTVDEVVVGLELGVIPNAASIPDIKWELGPLPDWLKNPKFSNFFNDRPKALTETPPDLKKVRSALEFAAENGQLFTHQLHRDNALFPLASLVQQYPEFKNEIENLYNEMSNLGGGNTSCNQAAFTHALQNIRHDRRTVGSLFYEMARLGWVYNQPSNIKNHQYVAENISFPRPSALDLSLTPRHRPFLYGNRLLRGEITVLAAPGGRGKSATAIAMALALTAGRKLIHDFVFGDAKKVLLFSTEDGREEFHRRVLAAKQHYNLTDNEIAQLHVSGVDDGRFTLTIGSEKAATVNQRAIDELARLIVEFGADVLVLDPLGPLIPFGLNDNGLMAQLIISLKQMASALDCAVLVLHHFKKGHDGSAESITGASALVNHARVAVTIEGMKNDEGIQFGVLPSELWRYFRLIDAKSNFAPPSKGNDWLKLETVQLNNPEPPIFLSGDAVQVVAPVTFAAITRRGYLDPSERTIVIADVITSVGNSSSPPYLKARGGAKGAVTINSMIAASISRLTNRPTSDAEVIAASLFEDLQREEILSVKKVKTPSRHDRDGVVLGPKAISDA